MANPEHLRDTDDAGPIPEANLPGHHPPVEQDKPTRPPRARARKRKDKPEPLTDPARFGFDFDPMFERFDRLLGIRPDNTYIKVARRAGDGAIWSVARSDHEGQHRRHRRHRPVFVVEGRRSTAPVPARPGAHDGNDCATGRVCQVQGSGQGNRTHRIAAAPRPYHHPRRARPVGRGAHAVTVLRLTTAVTGAGLDRLDAKGEWQLGEHQLRTSRIERAASAHLGPHRRRPGTGVRSAPSLEPPGGRVTQDRACYPRSLALIRHAQSAGNVANDAALQSGLAELDLPTRDMDVTLSSLGEAQADALGTWFAQLPATPDVVLCSPYRRALDTGVRAVAASGSTLRFSMTSVSRTRVRRS